MRALGHEAVLQQLLGLVADATTSEPRVCIWRSSEAILPAATALRHDPESACRTLGIWGPTRLSIVRDLLVHGALRAAVDFAGYLASAPNTTPRSQLIRSEPDLETRVFFRLHEALTCIEAGFFERAGSLLLQLERMQEALRTGQATTLLKANTRLLWSRLLQLQYLPKESLRRLDEAENTFASLKKLGAPAGVDLLRCRSLMALNRPDALVVATRVSKSSLKRDENIYGAAAEHYQHYLKARLYQLDESWDDSLTEFETAENLLKKSAHYEEPDALRWGYTVLGRGRSLAGRALASSRHKAEIDDGLKLLLQSRYFFRDRRFVPGEYTAHRQYLKVRAKFEGGEPSTQLRKEAYRLGLRTEVLTFQLESALDYAEALSRDGRPNRARTILEEIKRAVEGLSMPEVLASQKWRTLLRLLERTEDAADNAVEPAAQWGCSKGASEERQFVERCSKQAVESLVVIHGPRGEGRRLLVGRIVEARGETRTPYVLDGSRSTSVDVLKGLDEQIRLQSAVVLSNLDRWPMSLQEATFSRLQLKAGWQRRTYVTLTTSPAAPESSETLTPNISEILSKSQLFEIRPLESRPEDTLLLARGLVVRTLIRQGGIDKETAKRLVLTGDACRTLRHEFKRIGHLARAMRVLAQSIDIGRDLIDAGDGRLRLPSEAIHKYLSPPKGKETAATGNTRSSRRRRDAAAVSDSSGAWPGIEILTADEAMIRDLVIRAGGKLAVVATGSGVARSTLTKKWIETKRMEIWYAAGGKRR